MHMFPYRFLPIVSLQCTHQALCIPHLTALDNWRPIRLEEEESLVHSKCVNACTETIDHGSYSFQGVKHDFLRKLIWPIWTLGQEWSTILFFAILKNQYLSTILCYVTCRFKALLLYIVLGRNNFWVVFNRQKVEKIKHEIFSLPSRMSWDSSSWEWRSPSVRPWGKSSKVLSPSPEKPEARRRHPENSRTV